MALRIGKCRLCLKLGDFYSIFMVDNAIPLSEMAMACAQIKIYEGDGLPDKVCSECLEKLSAAYIFKQQCERSDAELRHAYGGISAQIATRKSSDSGLSAHADSAPSSSRESISSSLNDVNVRKRSTGNPIAPTISTHSGSYSLTPTSDRDQSFVNNDSKRQRLSSKPDNEKETQSKRQRLSSKPDNEKVKQLYTPKQYPCEECGRDFPSMKSVKLHMRLHKRQAISLENKSSVPAGDKANETPHTPEVLENKHKKNDIELYPCEKCGKEFKLKIMLNRHATLCVSKSSLQDRINQALHSEQNVIENYFKNNRSDPRARKNDESSKFAKEYFDCGVCGKSFPDQNVLVEHLAVHVVDGEDDKDLFSQSPNLSGQGNSFEEYQQSNANNLNKCPHCDRSFAYKKSLITHLAIKHSNESISPSVKMKKEDAHVSIKPKPDCEDDSSQDNNDNTCEKCDKSFTYKRSLILHNLTKHNSASGLARAQVRISDCRVTCLHCNIALTVKEMAAHNRAHSEAGVKPKSSYTCSKCNTVLKSLHGLQTHINLIHRIKKEKIIGQGENRMKVVSAMKASDFCEVVVAEMEHGTEVPGCHNDRLAPTPLVDMSGFICPLCNEKMDSISSFAHHMTWHKSMERDLECNICNEIIPDRRRHQRHMKGHSKDPEVDVKFRTCLICTRVCKHIHALAAHMRWHNQTRFKSNDLRCSICRKVFQHRPPYLHHMTTHMKKGEVTAGKLEWPCETSNKDGGVDNENACPTCGKILPNPLSLKRHMVWHNSKSSLFGNRYTCEGCQQQFTHKKRFDIHIRQCIGDAGGPFKCPVCHKGFMTETRMKNHERRHNMWQTNHKMADKLKELRAKKVKCPACDTYYPNLHRLIGHLKLAHPDHKLVKEESKPHTNQHYACIKCAKIFTSERKLQNHAKSHTRSLKFYKCKFCGRNSPSIKCHRIHIKAHLTMKYRNSPLKCGKCDNTFTVGYDLHHHMQSAHGITETWVADRSNETDAGPLEDLQCSLCKKMLSSRLYYEKHLDYHNTFRCNYCYEYFTSKIFLQGHLIYNCHKRKLLGETDVFIKKLKCKECYKPFSLQIKLDCHRRTQHGVAITEKVLDSSGEFVCDFCFYVYGDEESLDSHKKAHLRVAHHYGCMYCKSKFPSLHYYRKHKVRHLMTYLDEPIKCEHCGESFDKFRSFIDHKREVHNDTKEWFIPPEEVGVEMCHICQKEMFNLSRHLYYHEQNRCKKCGEYFFSRTISDAHMCDGFKLNLSDDVSIETISSQSPVKDTIG